MTNETKCSCGKPKYIGREVCYNCYKEMFYDYKSQYPLKTYEKDGEPDFELKHDIAQISASSSDTTQYTVAGGIVFQVPKKYVFNEEARVKDYDALVRFLLANFSIYEDAKDFGKVKHMFKEVGK